MWQGLVKSATRLVDDLQRGFLPPRPGARRTPAGPVVYSPLERVVLTDGVGHTLFDGYARHRAEPRGQEETGWLLLGLREAHQALALAVLPAGALREASASHILFNAEAQAVASRVIRQVHRRLTMLGVVHTHPGSLRHPSDGDLRGDRQWVRHLRGQEGVFGIGTADAPVSDAAPAAHQPCPHVQCLGTLRFSWYALGQGETRYRPLPVGLTLGPDLARPLHTIWTVLEHHASRIDRVLQQQAGARAEVVDGPALLLTVPLADRAGAVRVLVGEQGVRYYLERGGELLEVDHHNEGVDRGVYLLLAELAARP